MTPHGHGHGCSPENVSCVSTLSDPGRRKREDQDHTNLPPLAQRRADDLHPRGSTLSAGFSGCRARHLCSRAPPGLRGHSAIQLPRRRPAGAGEDDGALVLQTMIWPAHLPSDGQKGPRGGRYFKYRPPGRHSGHRPPDLPPGRRRRAASVAPRVARRRGTAPWRLLPVMHVPRSTGCLQRP